MASDRKEGGDASLPATTERPSQTTASYAIQASTGLSNAAPTVQPAGAASEQEWTWNVINEGLSNIWCGNEFLGCCETFYAKKLCQSHKAGIAAAEQAGFKRGLTFIERNQKTGEILVRYDKR